MNVPMHDGQLVCGEFSSTVAVDGRIALGFLERRYSRAAWSRLESSHRRPRADRKDSITSPVWSK